jgi:two-component system sensor histidine kinase HydH
MNWTIAAVSFLLTGCLAGVVLYRYFDRYLARRRNPAGNTPSAAPDRVVELYQLAGGLAHEIKNPLSTINVNLELLAEDLRHLPGDEPARWLRRLETVQAETGRLKTTLDDFLRFARQEELSLARTNLCDVVSELVDFFGPQTQARHVVLRHALPGHPVICNIDVKLLKQAMLNLMINANDAMPTGGELLLQVTANGLAGTIEVTDTGSGIAPDDLERIFDVYYSSKVGGTGLGLPTTRKIIERHGGQLAVDSAIGKGTRFTITLPLADA